MKNQQLILKESVMTEVSYFQERNQNQVVCPFNKPATQACQNKKCKKNAFLCTEQNCGCSTEHKKCFKVTLKSLIENIESKQVSIDSLETSINNEIQEIIDLLSNYRDEAINKMKKDFELFGLNENEIQLLQEVKNGKCEKTTGSKIWEIINSDLQNERAKKMIEETCNELQKLFKIAKQSFQKTVKNSTLAFDSLKSQMERHFFVSKASNHSEQNSQSLIHQEVSLNSSKIMTQLKQFSTLSSFFAPKKIKSAKLIYRASENEFQAKKFHQKCDGVPNTLVLVETEYGKKIGGYTPIKWASPQTCWVYAEDDSMTSFVFSLTNGDKFQLINKDKAVYQYCNSGPDFGQNFLWIKDKANQNNFSMVNIASTYKNKNYHQNDKQSLQRFCGNPSNSNLFKIKQWQVWSLSFT